VKKYNGLAVVQDPEDATYSGMPTSAVQNVQVDYVLPVAAMGALLVELTQQPAPQPTPTPSDDLVNVEAEMADLTVPDFSDEHLRAAPSVYGCPECGGVLWELHDGDLVRYRCRVGHAFTAQHLLAEQGEALEEAFWVAFRALEERAALLCQMAERTRRRGLTTLADRFEDQAKNVEAHAAVVRKILLSGDIDTVVDEEDQGAAQSAPPVKSKH
jgi:two-component system, chemotaxis family, protein-glutamate methylesterase/glutaminase